MYDDEINVNKKYSEITRMDEKLWMAYFLEKCYSFFCRKTQKTTRTLKYCLKAENKSGQTIDDFVKKTESY